MSSKRYTEEFKIQAVNHITENGHSVSEVGRRLGVTTKSLYSKRRVRYNAGAAPWVPNIQSQPTKRFFTVKQHTSQTIW